MPDTVNSEIVDYDALYTLLEPRLGDVHTRQRIGIEKHYHQKVYDRKRRLLYLENWYSIHGLMRGILRASGFYWRGKRNALNIQTRYNTLYSPLIPTRFHNFQILHLSDLHIDMSPEFVHALISAVRAVNYDMVVMTGDYRGLTFGSFQETLKRLALLRVHLKGQVYGVLGNHDCLGMVPEMEKLGIQMLMNENCSISLSPEAPEAQQTEKIYLAGIDDAHFFRVDNIEKARAGIPDNQFSLLLSHTPEVYLQAAHAGFNAFLCGHTHGGQICLPGGTPIILDSNCPRYVGKGAWHCGAMQGYTSVGAGSSIIDVRLNCLPEITIHRLHQSK
ncbi:metallophosphoesterase [Oleiphilus messinensis]|uniref:Metallophosphoesterase n=1 Tax=Oleiphilus messinensis TaxID=141451 RepID=A0A1Y0IDD9_9GAMM|nr:metallophosphoesterase [Oleiphilus messinensis]ARU57393.1 metallophosphoesterase [Oleiphilus messinensis]